jgi:hypothetical protein
VLCYRSLGDYGIYMLGSMEPFASQDAPQMAARMPPAARADLVQWYPSKDPVTYLTMLLSNRVDIPHVLDADRHAEVTDDQPFNEYYLLRTLAPRPH